MIVGGSGVGISVVAAVAAADIIRDGVPPRHLRCSISVSTTDLKTR
jgi:hypothetical protein